MKIGISTFLFPEWSLEQVAKYSASLGYEMVELPIWEGNNHLDMASVFKGQGKAIRKMLAEYDLSISAINNATAGQLVLGPLDESTDIWAPARGDGQVSPFFIASVCKSAKLT